VSRALRAVRLVLRLLPVVVVLALVVPGSGVRPTTLSLVKIEKAQGYDAGSDVVWVLVLGSDAAPGVAPTEGDTDAFQLLAIDASTGAAAGIGIPRDSYVNLHGDLGMSRINIALKEGVRNGDGFATVVGAVDELVGVTPDYVLVTAGDGFADMVDALGGEVEVDSPLGFTTDTGDLVVKEGLNRFTADEALLFAESRNFAGQGDLVRSANHQALLIGLLKELQRQDHQQGFVEAVALAGLDGIVTEGASPLDLYRLLNLLTSIDPAHIQGCVVPGRDITDVAGNLVIDPDEVTAQRLGREASDDATFDGSCA
jgi:LCP family protein required for cell wall assembly